MPCLPGNEKDRIANQRFSKKTVDREGILNSRRKHLQIRDNKMRYRSG
jgi:hypothetical protein